jgi:CheY-like chemotaxis protein/tetratricopeptide (TPR) repeat protein
METGDHWGAFRPPRREAAEVLLVEDEHPHAELIADALRPIGVKIRLAGSGAEALAALNDRVFDLIILDLGLGPGVGGMSVLGWIRNQGIATPVIVVTVTNDVHSATRALKEGAKDYIVKERGYLDKLLTAVLEHLPSRDDTAVSPEAVLARFARGVFVGRTQELSQLEGALREAASGRGRLVLLSGEAGIGKTSLLRTAVSRAEEDGFGVLHARAHDVGGAPAFYLWTEVLREFLARPESADVIAFQQASAAALLPLIPALAERLHGVSPGAADSHEERFRLLEGVSVLLREAARPRPLLIALEDLQWADVPSLQLLRFLAREMEATRMLIVGTCRTAEAEAPLGDLITEIAREPASVLFPLRGLSEGEIRELVASIFGQTCPRAFARMMHARTEGNPLFVKEILRHLVEEEIVWHDGTRWTGPTDLEEIPIPDSVRKVIRHRLERATSDCRGVLGIAAVSGREFDARVVQELAKLSGDDFAAALTEAENASLIARVRGNRYRFAHPLFHEALYHELAPARRTELHWRTGEALESLHGSKSEAHVERLTHHFIEGVQAGDADKAVYYAMRAGQRAGAMMGHEEAARHFEAALQVLERSGANPDERRCEILLLLSDALWRAGAFDRAREAAGRAAEAARRTGCGESLARAALAFAGRQQGFGAVNSDAQVVGLLREGLQALSDEQHALRPLLLARLGEELAFTHRDASGRSLARRAIELARAQSDPSVLAATLKATHWALWSPEGVEDRLSLADEIVQLADRSGDRAMRLEGQLVRVWSLIEVGDSRGAEYELRQCAQLARSQRQPYYQWLVAVTRVCLAFMTGSLDRVAALAEEAKRLGEVTPNRNVSLFHEAQMAGLRRLEGRFDELARLQTEIVEPHPLLVPVISCARANRYSDQGRVAETRAEFERWAVDDFVTLPRNVTWLTSVTFLTNACAFLGDARRAERLYSLLAPFAGRNVATIPLFTEGAAAHYLALLAATMERWDDAERHFTDALEMNTCMGTKQWAARTQLAYGSVLLRRGRSGDRLRARELLEAAAQGAAALGMPVVQRQAEEEIARAAGPVRRTIPGETESGVGPHGEAAGSDAPALEAVERAIRAAEHAAKLMLHEDAVQHLEAALHGLDANDLRRAETLVLLAEALWRAGAFERAKKAALGAVEIARELGDGEVLGRASLAYAGQLTAFGVVVCSEATLTLLQESVEALGEGHDALRAQLLARLAEELSLSEEHEKRCSLARRAVVLARRAGDPAVLAAVLRSTYWALWVPADLERRQAVTEEIIGLATEVGDLALVLEGRVFGLLAFLEGGDIAAARRDLDACDRLALELRQPYYRWIVGVVHGCMALMEGRLNDAEHLVQEALKLTDPAHNPNAALFFGVQWGHLLWLRGRVHEIETLLSGLGSLSPLLNHVIRCVLASVYCEQGRLADAQNEFERLSSRDFADLPRDVTWTYSMAVLAGVCGLLGDGARARLVYEALRPFSDRIVVLSPAVAFGSVSHCLGQLATAMRDWEAATHHFDQALVVHRRLGMPHWTALTQVEYARMLLQGKPEERERAQALLSAAVDTAMEMGLPAVAARARAVEDESGGAHAASRLETRGQPPAEAPVATGSEEQRSTSTSEGLFRREGEFWTLGFEGKVVHVKDVVGLRYICELLRRPRESVPATVLAATVNDWRLAQDWPPDLVDADGLKPAGFGSNDPAADARAVIEYRRRLHEAMQLLDEAKRRNDRHEMTSLEREIELLKEELEESSRRWKEHPETERIRQNVTRAIGNAVAKIRREHPKLGRYLDTHINRGYFCAHEPDPDRPIRWQF